MRLHRFPRIFKGLQHRLQQFLAYGRLRDHEQIVLFDIGSLVFYCETETGMTYWSLADSQFTADKYKSSGSIMETGRRFALTSTGIDASLV